jgi:hypothetical protein
MPAPFQKTREKYPRVFWELVRKGLSCTGMIEKMIDLPLFGQ